MLPVIGRAGQGHAVQRKHPAATGAEESKPKRDGEHAAVGKRAREPPMRILRRRFVHKQLVDEETHPRALCSDTQPLGAIWFECKTLIRHDCDGRYLEAPSSRKQPMSPSQTATAR